MTDFLADTVLTRGAHLALTDGERRWSYADLDQDVARLTRALRARGARPGTRVATVLPPTADGVLATHAVLRSGAVLTPLNPRHTSAELAAALDVLAPTVIVVDGAPGAASAVEEAASGVGAGSPERRPTLVSVAQLLDAAPRAAPAPERVVPAPSGSAVILWTSGTAGRPRGVGLSTASLRWVARASRQRLDLRPEDAWHASLSLAHVGGLVLVLRAALLGSAVVARGAFEVGDFNALVDAGMISHASLVPTMLSRVLDHRGGRSAPGTLRCVLVGGAHAARPLVDRAIAAGFPLALTYGMTETTSQVATAPPELVRTKPGTVGEPLPGTFVTTDDGGEILVMGEGLALGYVGADEPLVDVDGWLHTGDLGELDPDGHLWVSGRRSDRIVTGGVNVDPAEVEDVLRLHEGVADAAVVGLADDEWGQVIAAGIVRVPGAYPDPGELENLARARLTTAKIPRRIRFLDDLPRNRNGKVDREAVAELLVAPDPGAAPAPGVPDASGRGPDALHA